MEELPRIGFKEWALVCRALGAGKQSLVLRKGGIHEGARGFRFDQERFWLFPTGFHEQTDGLNPEVVGDLGNLEGASSGKDEGGTVEVRYFAEVDLVTPLEQWSQVEALRRQHVWSEDLLKERFVYTEDEGIWFAALRIYELDKPWEFPDAAKYGGCRSWLNLPEEVPSSARLRPVLTDEEHERRMTELRKAIALEEEEVE